eukprot:m.87502 g.87502  ORF g.87502 m.87502 type:complete len:271 (+) comp15130_c0_seq2:158-970(+)
MELLVWGPGHGLPSGDPDCLVVLTYLKFTNMKSVRIFEEHNTSRSPNGELPALIDGSTTVTGACRIIGHLRNKQMNADYDLTGEVAADTLAFEALVFETLRPFVLHTLWLDEENYQQTTRPWINSLASFPHVYTLPSRLRKHAKKIVAQRLPDQLFKDARNCVLSLDGLLKEDSAYFFGKEPSHLDSLVFGYLAVAWKARLPNDQLRLCLEKEASALVKLLDKILSEHFAGEEIRQKRDEATFWNTETLWTAASVGVALSAMGLYFWTRD